MSIRWEAEAKDGSVITSDDGMAALHSVKPSPNTGKRYFKRITVKDGALTYAVTFEQDGDAYISAPRDTYYITEYKMHPGQLVFSEEGGVYYLGYAGIDMMGKPAGKRIAILPGHGYVPAEDFTDLDAII